MALARVFVDTNELFPFTAMDLMLTLAEDQFFEFVWSEELLDEWQRVIAREGKRTKESARQVAAAVRGSFAEGRIDPSLYRDSAWPALPDEDDRVHGAAASAGADVLLTRNLDDFPTHLLPKLVIMTADDYLTSVFRHRPRDFVASVRKLAASKRKPPITDNDYVERLRNAGCVRLASKLAGPLSRE